VAALVAAAERAGVARLLTVGTDPASSRAALAAASAHDGVFAAVGHHPNGAGGFGPDEQAQLRELAADPRCRAVGETGLDFFRDRAPRDDQERAFRAHRELAAEVGKPLIVHTRAAEGATLDALADLDGAVPVLLHCFSMPDHLDECLERDYRVSFAGNVTYPGAAALADAACRVPLERLLVETDAPYLAPQAVRGRPNAPANVVHTARFVAERRGISYSELEAAVDRNASELFGW